ncbi:phosphate ABC transporter permease subunit PstC [Micromonospora siamensis]|uniref:Phosphate transport system permease protein n=1 Tax=Micromonospora siamensis TaxID=299152 RepID=A0A1C5GL91_9ACTN|nr:phosphate ABC transporter permease subunit PstC [Micromonospora siamensis]SCG34560.1 phosphate ABC transporter membrane protein 1, PhoT family [Micromonospora siamensis]
MGDIPPRSAGTGTGGPGVTQSHARPAGSALPADFSPANRDPGRPIGGGGALPRRRKFGAETLFRLLTMAAGSMVLIIIVAIAVFLVSKAVPALRANTENFFTYEGWSPNGAEPKFGIGALAFGTVLSSAIALVIAVPVALGIALFLTHYAPRRLGTALGFLIDLLAAVPSVVFGLWGRDYFVGPVTDLSVWLNKYFGWIPIFGGDGPFGRSVLLGSLVLAIMVLPIVTSLSREVFLQTPTANEEAALALGSTKWEMIRTAVLPYGRPGVIGAVMLGLGRALGETIALALTLSFLYEISFNILENGGNSIAANIAVKFGEADATGRGALIASGLVLFVITLIVNMTARAIIYRRREFTESAA